MSTIQTLKINLPVEEVDVVGSISCGMRQEWVSGGNDRMQVELSCGAGLGNGWGQVTVAVSGEENRYFRFNAGEIIRLLVAEIDRANGGAT